MEDVFLFLLLTFVSSSVGTMTGFGTSTIMVPVLSLFLPIPQTLLFVGIIHWFGDIWKMIFFKKGWNTKIILLFGIPGVIVSFLAARLPVTISETLLQKSLGLFLILYVLFLLFNPQWKIKPSHQTAVTGGVLSGFFAGIFGVGGAVRSTFLSAYNLEKSVFLFTSGAIGLLVDSSRLTQYIMSEVTLDQSLLITLILCIPVSLLGAYLAKRLIDKIPQQSFRLLIAIALLLVGLRYLIFS
ncbi:sulfite exporter TauE/SafE family protein [Candidatus Roizmanbacteria bacterium]|nr:sulfite exporter TauE/SafE family protein [Candidatus Roizmanbacteria bacterium]